MTRWIWLLMRSDSHAYFRTTEGAPVRNLDLAKLARWWWFRHRPSETTQHREADADDHIGERDSEEKVDHGHEFSLRPVDDGDGRAVGTE